MSLWDDPNFSKPTSAVGDWEVERSTYFWHEAEPLVVKFAVEKMTVQLLCRDPASAHDDGRMRLSYSGTSGAGGHPSFVRLELIAVQSDRKLYRLTSRHTAPQRWEQERSFTDSCDRTFAYWCLKLDVASQGPELSRLLSDATSPASVAALIATVRKSVAEEDEAAAVVVDRAPIAALQTEVLDALRAGKVFFTAHKEGGTHLLFDGKHFLRDDYGDEPNENEVYATDAQMLDSLYRFFEWDANHPTYPHKVPELQVWQYIRTRLKSRHAPLTPLLSSRS